jgi:hypothetical protein
MPLSSNYRAVDRGLHHLAFSLPFVQRLLGELENDLFKGRLDRVDSQHEVFITGLPRAGTTLLLEMLYRTGRFRTFTYRHMPFVLAPMIWQRVTSTHQKPGQAAERAHGDGVPVSFDSPEAFEEVVWLAYMKDRLVKETKIETLAKGEISSECAAALQTAVRKILALSPGPPGAERPRYVSKNNANLSRIAALSELFPTSTILVAFRDPAAQAGSLSHQHRRFLLEHSQDGFSRRYMRWLGHYEFGQNLKPIDFSGWLDGEAVPIDPDVSFWVRYWIAAYAFALAQRTPNVRFVDFDRLLREKEGYLEKIASVVRLSSADALVREGALLRAPTSRPVNRASCLPELWDEARRVHADLRAASI